MTDPYAESDTWPNPPASQQPARPATLTASEPSRVRGEGSDAQEARVAAYAEAMGLAPRYASSRAKVARVVAVADAERNEAYARGYHLAREHWKARAEASEAEVERLEESGRNWHKSALTNAAACLRAERARDAALAEVAGLRDRLGRVEALRDRWLAVDVPSAEVTSWSHYAGAALRAARALPVTGDTEDASPAAEDAAPSVLGMVEEIYRREDADHEPFFRDKVTGEPCPRRGNVLCTLPYSPDHRHVAAHMRDTGAASPTEQATEGGA